MVWRKKIKKKNKENHTRDGVEKKIKKTIPEMVWRRKEEGRWPRVNDKVNDRVNDPHLTAMS